MNKNIFETKDGVLYFDGCNTLELASTYGTPLYIYSKTEILNRIREAKECFGDKYPNARIAYAAKAFSSLAMMDICNQEGICVDVVSGGELFTAKTAGLPGERIEFNGNNKSELELLDAVNYGVGRIIMDGLGELSRLEELLASSFSQKVKILFRITPGIKADTHDHLVTGKKDSKFGIPLDDEIFFPLVEAAINSEYVEFMGLHFHIGSQLFDVEPYLAALEILLEKVAQIKNRFGYTVEEINLGGGFGVTYTTEERKSYDYFLAPMVERIHEFYRDVLGEDPSAYPNLVIEPGRSIVAEAGATLYTIGETKEVPGLRKFASVDGGMGDNIRPALYGAQYQCHIANKMEEPYEETVTISGKYCETGDILIKDAKLPATETGDILAITSTGAYGYSMASNYNCNPVPAVVLCEKGTHRLIVKRQTYEDVIGNQLL